jgi:hypothetical protein
MATPLSSLNLAVPIVDPKTGRATSSFHTLLKRINDRATDTMTATEASFLTLAVS